MPLFHRRDRPGDAFGAVRVGSRQPLSRRWPGLMPFVPHRGSTGRCVRRGRGRQLPPLSRRWPGSLRSEYSSGIDRAMRSASVVSLAARSGSVAATALAMRSRADAFWSPSRIDRAMRSASAVSRAARSGSIPATASAMLARVTAFELSSVIDQAASQRVGQDAGSVASAPVGQVRGSWGVAAVVAWPGTR